MNQLSAPHPILLIDGNNLAHFLYPHLGAADKMSASDSQQLMTHLDHYARQHNQSIEIELCFDRLPDKIGSLQTNLRVYGAEYPQNGDDLIIDRFWYHQIGRHPCLVITNDGNIIEEIKEAAGNYMQVFDFVRRPGINNPVFRDPADLPQIPVPNNSLNEEQNRVPLSASIYFRIVEDPRLHNSQKRSQYQKNLPPREEQSINQRTSTLPDTVQFALGENFQQPIEPQTDRTEESASGKCTALADVQTNSRQLAEEPHYFLDLNRWPIEEGIRFLIKSFCQIHRSEYQDLIDLIDPAKANREDLRALAELLLYTCSGEENFARRGSLLTRVRLTLLQARGELVSLSGLAQAAGLKKHGLQGRIKAKANHWVEILS